jgi:enoyl-CoA hydratase/carnithine racemase
VSDYQTILTDVSDKVATIWLNRPEQRNAFAPDMTRELHEAFGEFEADDGVRAIVVTGAGKYFSAGADLGRRGGGTFSRSADADTAEQRQRGERAEPRRMRTPIIAAMNGSAVGMGITLPVSWDVRFAAADAKYGFVFTRRGVVPEAAWRPAVQGQGLPADAVKDAAGPESPRNRSGYRNFLAWPAR